MPIVLICLVIYFNPLYVGDIILVICKGQGKYETDSQRFD